MVLRRKAATIDHDVCVVGSGFAGTFLALRLSELGIRTLLLEAGVAPDPDGPVDGRGSRLPVVETGDAVPVTADNRAIELGGTSRRWNGVCTRLLPGDFDNAARHGYGVDWPIRFDDLAPYYDQAEQVLYVHGSPRVTDAEPPRPPYPVERPALPTPSQLATMPSFALAFGTRDGAPTRLVDVELPSFAASATGTLLTDRTVTRLHADRRGRITEVEACTGDGRTERFRARHVVLAAGVVETVRVLLASTSASFPAGIGNAHGLVGRHLHGHPRLRRAVERTTADVDARGVHRSYAPGAVTRASGLGSLALDVNADAEALMVTVTSEFEPIAENRVQFDPDTLDRWGRPVLRIDAHRTPADHATTAAALATLAAAGAPGDAELTWFHPAGTCRMGASAEVGVVDRDCRVFGTENLHVCGAAVFPTSGPTNPTLTVVALALRLADHLADHLAGRLPSPARR